MGHGYIPVIPTQGKPAKTPPAGRREMAPQAVEIVRFVRRNGGGDSAHAPSSQASSASSHGASTCRRNPPSVRLSRQRSPANRTAAEGEPPSRSADVPCMSASGASAPATSTVAQPSSTGVAQKPSRQPSAASRGASVTSSARSRAMRSPCAPAGASAYRPSVGAPGMSAATAASRSPEISVRPSPSTARAASRGLSTSTPDGRRAGAQSRSRIKALPLGIERAKPRDRRAALRAQMIDRERLPEPREAVLDKAERDRPLERRAHVARRHVTQRAARLARALNQMRAGHERRCARRHGKADELFPPPLRRDGQEERALADIFVSAGLARAPKTEVVRHGRPIGVLADDDIALLRPQNHQRLDAHEAAAEGGQLLLSARAQGAGARGGDAQLVSAVASEAHPRDAQRAALERAGREAHVRQALVVERHV